MKKYTHIFRFPRICIAEGEYSSQGPESPVYAFILLHFGAKVKRILFPQSLLQKKCLEKSHKYTENA